MPIDTSIYGNIQQPPSILDQYSKLAALKSLQSRTRLEDLQGQAAQQGLTDAESVRQAGIESGGDTSKLPGLLLGRGAVKSGMEAQAAQIKAAQEQAVTQHTQAQTQEEKAKAFATSAATIIRDPSDAGLESARAIIKQQTGHDIPPEILTKLQSATPEARRQLAINIATSHPAAGLVLKELFPEAKTTSTSPDYQSSTVTTARPGLTLQQPGAGTPKPKEPVDLAKVSPADMEAGYRYFSDGTLPPNMGRGIQGTAQATRIREISAAISQNLGISPEEVRSNQLAFKGSGAALTQLMRRESQIGANVRNFDFNADQALKLSDQIDRTGVPVVNSWINAGRRSVQGNPQLSAFDVAVKTTVNEFAQIVGGTTAGATTEGEKKKAEALLNAAQTPEQIKAVINQMRVESQNRMKSFAAQKAETLQNMRSGRGGGTTGSSVNSAPSAISPEAQKLIDKYAPNSTGAPRG